MVLSAVHCAGRGSVVCACFWLLCESTGFEIRVDTLEVEVCVCVSLVLMESLQT